MSRFVVLAAGRSDTAAMVLVVMVEIKIGVACLVGPRHRCAHDGAVPVFAGMPRRLSECSTGRAEIRTDSRWLAACPLWCPLWHAALTLPARCRC